MPSVLLPPCIPQQCGKDFRFSVRRPSPIYVTTKKVKQARIVPAFTIQAMQKNTKVLPPPRMNPMHPEPIKPTKFKEAYMRGEFPVSIEFRTSGKRLKWKVPVEKLDYHFYLPIFFEGISESSYPYSFIIEKGITELISKGSHKVLPTVPQLIIPMKKALSTKRPNVIMHLLTCLNLIISRCDKVGEALVPYYRQLLPVLNLFKNSGNSTTVQFQTNRSLADQIDETLQIMETYGGPDAFINIKYMIPTYESCVMN